MNEDIETRKCGRHELAASTGHLKYHGSVCWRICTISKIVGWPKKDALISVRNFPRGVYRRPGSLYLGHASHRCRVQGTLKATATLFFTMGSGRKSKRCSPNVINGSQQKVRKPASVDLCNRFQERLSRPSLHSPHGNECSDKEVLLPVSRHLCWHGSALYTSWNLSSYLARLRLPQKIKRKPQFWFLVAVSIACCGCRLIVHCPCTFSRICGPRFQRS